jgi:hypothetical protein
MSDTPNLILPYIAAAQAQKHVTHNEALSLIDGLLQLSIVSRGLNTPPATAVDGNRYLIGAAPITEWLGHAGQIGLRMEGAWRFLTPRKGWQMWVEAESVPLIFDGTNWISQSAPTVLQNLSLLGVNATADATNKVSVNSSALLFNNIGNGVQIKLNKNASADTASLLYQTGFSGRAEMGTTGDDGFHIKVSPDGASWKEAIAIDAASGLATVFANPTAALGIASKQYVDAASGGAPGGTAGQVQFKNGTTFGGFTLNGDALLNTTTGALTLSAVANSKLSTMAAFTLKGNNTAGAATPIDLTIAQTKTLLAIATADVSGLGTLATQSGTFAGTHSGASSGTNTGDQIIALTGDVSGTGVGTFAATISAGAITNAKLAPMAAFTFKANATNAATNPQDLSIDQTLIALNFHALINARMLVMG